MYVYVWKNVLAGLDLLEEVQVLTPPRRGSERARRCMSGSVERGACVLKADATLAGVNDPLPSAPCAGPGYSGAVIPAFEVLLLSCVPMGCYEYLL